MPRIRREEVPDALLGHLLQRIRERNISYSQVQLFSAWVLTDPEVPHGKWYKRFAGMVVCGEGELVKTFLREGQAPDGEEGF